jgi:hypothetical protein
MRNKRRFKNVCRVALAAATLSAPLTATRAEESTAVQREACKPDVYRLCKWYIPSHAGITYCLHKNIDQLSPECRAVLEGRLR